MQKEYSYSKVAKAIFNDFISGKLKAGDTIPTEFHLAEFYEVSRSTIRKSIQELIKNNILYSVQGSGTYITKDQIANQYYTLDSFGEYAKKIGGNPSTKVLHFEIIKADLYISQLLEIDINQDAFYTKRVRYLNDIPSEYEISYMPLALFPDLSYEAMAHSKYHYIENTKGYTIKGTHINVIPIIADKETMEFLQISKKIPILCVKSVGFLEDKTVFEYTESYRVPDRHAFRCTVSRDNKII